MPRKVTDVVIVENKEGRFLVKTYSDGMVEREPIMKKPPKKRSYVRPSWHPLSRRSKEKPE